MAKHRGTGKQLEQLRYSFSQVQAWRGGGVVKEKKLILNVTWGKGQGTLC